MRTVTTAVLWLVMTMATIVAIGAGWAAVNVQREDGFVALASEMGTDREVQEAAAELAGVAFVQQRNIPDLLSDRVQGLITDAILRLTSTDGWEAAWQETVRRTHAQLFDGPTPTTVVVDVAPLVDLAVDEITAVLPIDLSPPDQMLATVSEDDPSEVVQVIAQSSRIAVVATGTAVIAGLLALAVSRRRSTTFALLGGGVVTAAGVWWVANRVGLPWAMDRFSPPNDDALTLRTVLADRVAASMDSTLLWVALTGGAMVALGLLSRSAANRA